MRKHLVVLIAAMTMVICWTGVARAQSPDVRQEMQQFKLQQKRERNALKFQQKNMKDSWNNGYVSKAQRDRMKHQMAREQRDLKSRQKDAMQDLKDRLKSWKEMQRVYGQ